MTTNDKSVRRLVMLTMLVPLLAALRLLYLCIKLNQPTSYLSKGDDALGIRVELEKQVNLAYPDLGKPPGVTFENFSYLFFRSFENEATIERRARYGGFEDVYIVTFSRNWNPDLRNKGPSRLVFDRGLVLMLEEGALPRPIINRRHSTYGKLLDFFE